MTKIIILFFVYAFEAFVAYTYFSDNYETKYKPFISYLIAFGLHFIGFLACIGLDSIVLNDITFFIINLLYCIISFRISVKSGIFHSSILLAIMFATEIIAEAGISFLFHIPIDAYKTDYTVLIIIVVISKLLYFTVSKIISMLFSYKRNNASEDMKKNLILFIYPLIITGMLTLFMYTSFIYDFSMEINLMCAVLSVVSVVFCCLIFIVNRNFQRQEKELISLQSENQRNEMNQVFYEMLEKKNNEQRILVHDIKHHFAAINAMDTISDIKKYVADIQPELDEYRFIGKTKNKMFDLILDRYAGICNMKKIDFAVDIRASNLDFIDDKDLVSMLSNILDNAVEAAVGCAEPTIRLSTKRDKSFVVLTVINSCLRKPKTAGERLITTKSNTAYHGCGIKSVEKTLNKYNGICHWDFDESNNEFHFNVLFNKN